MQILTTHKNIGNKAEKIKRLFELGYLIPQSYLCDITNIHSLSSFISQDSETMYMIRPSFIGEDGNEKSLAGKFHSIGPLNYVDFLMYIKKSEHELLGEFKAGKFILGSIIVQEFIESDIYGVFFTRNPENLLLNGNYNVGNSHDEVTSGKGHLKVGGDIKLTTKLSSLGSKIEVHFGYPQDIEFTILKSNIVILQTRNITSGDIFVPNFKSLQNISGSFQNIDNGEFGNVKYFGASLISSIYFPLHIGGSIFGKFHYSSKNTPLQLTKFIKTYRTYLHKKILLSILQKIIFFQKLDKIVLKEFYKNYHYSFDIFTPSQVDKTFQYNTNLKTRLLLKSERYKHITFCELENIKKYILKKNTLGTDINYLTYDEWFSGSQDIKQLIAKRKNIPQAYKYKRGHISIIHGKIFGEKKVFGEEKSWIYRGSLQGKKVTLKEFEKTERGQVLLIENLSEDITDYLDHIDGLIAKDGSIYSHNAILLREYKIPSFIEK